MGRGTTAPTAWSGTELGLPLLSRAGGRSVFPCPRLAFGEGAERLNHGGNSSSSNLFCSDPVSNGAPACPKACVGLISLLLINKELFRASSS